MKKANVRIEIRKLPPHADRKDREKSLTKALRDLKRECDAYGVLKSYKSHEFYTRPGDIRRRKEAAKRHLQQRGITERSVNQQEWGSNYA